MITDSGRVRIRLQEYGKHRSVASDIGLATGQSSDEIATRLVLAGSRIARLLGRESNPIDVSGGSLRVADIAGLVMIDRRIQLEVVPKFLEVSDPTWSQDFFFLSMLARHGVVLSNERIGSSTGQKADLATLIARAMTRLFWENHRRPLRTYRTQHVTDFMLDGDCEADELLLPHPDGYPQRIVEYTRHNQFNSIIAGAAQVLSGEVRDLPTRRQLIRLSEVLGTQADVRSSRRVTVPSRARHWQPLVDLSCDVLNGFSLKFEREQYLAPGFVVHTWQVWESLISTCLRHSFSATAVRCKQSFALGSRSRVNTQPDLGRSVLSVYPDVVLGVPVSLVIDAKYKGRAGDRTMRIAEADIYESLAFARATAATKVALMYPRVAALQQLPTGSVSPFEQVLVDGVTIVGVDVEVRGISRIGGYVRFRTGLFDGIESLSGE